MHMSKERGSDFGCYKGLLRDYVAEVALVMGRYEISVDYFPLRISL